VEPQKSLNEYVMEALLEAGHPFTATGSTFQYV
jgi:hypothetical protein